MRILFVTCLAVLVAAVFATANTSAQEPAPDFGEASLLVLACTYMADIASAEGINIKACRRNAPEEIEGYKARVHLKLFTDFGQFQIDLNLKKSLWWVQDWKVQ